MLFRNYDLKTIKSLLIEIGEHKYNQAMENMKIPDSKPLSMRGFYIEATQHYLKLCYRYPSRYVIMIMDVETYKNIPVEGWKRIEQ